MPEYDLLICNAHILDPSQNLDAVADLAVSAGRIVAIEPQLPFADCPDIRDASGHYLSPGLIDLHGHWYEAGLYGIDPEICLNHGVTTAIDAGTAGFANFPDFRRTAMEQTRVGLLGFVHVSGLGLHAPFAEELTNLDYARPLETAEVIATNRDRAVGVKVRIGAMSSNHDIALTKALEAANLAKAPLMTHVSRGAGELNVLSRLRPGDILTHCFHGNANELVRNAQWDLQSALAARERGIIFDIGHGCGSFNWETARKAFEVHFLPDTLSTDLHRYSVDDPWNVSLPDVMSKFLALGMSLGDVIYKSTAAPARAIGRSAEMGSLRIGAPADLFLFTIDQGEFHFRDAQLRTVIADRRILPALTVKSGICYEPGAIQPRLRPVYPCDDVVFGPARRALMGN